ncbi:hypothetical protein AB0F42_19250 [Streptomyces buecherae]|uniref:ATP-grasp domain-containing protein n=1 Tax=Streptomyces buecherae TaxID=2763006 RepID=UPI0033ED6A31
MLANATRIDIVVQSVASFRIDPAVLSRDDRATTLIVSPANWSRLVDRRRRDVFDEIVVLDDFSTEPLANAVSGLIERSGVAPQNARLLCHDGHSLSAVAQVRARLGVPGDLPASLEAFRDKLALKATLEGANIRVPRHLSWDAQAYADDPDRYADDVIATVGLPAFAKPVDESGGVGAFRLDTVEGMHTWAAVADGEHGFEVDEFVQGTLYHVETLIDDGRILHVRANQYLHPCHTYADGLICSTVTLPEDHPHHARLLEFNRRVLEELKNKPRSSVFHHEICIRPDGESVFLEIDACAPAALTPATGRIRWGLDIEEAHFRLQRGEEVHVPEQLGPHAAFVYVPKQAGKVVARHRPKLVSPHRWVWNVAVGDALGDPTDIRAFVASVLLWNDDLKTLCEDLKALGQHQALTTTPR